MISEKMQGYVKNSSAIRAMFEEGKGSLPFTGRRMSMISAWEIPMCRLQRR